MTPRNRESSAAEPAPGEDAPDQAVLLARRYERYGALCTLLIICAWHVGFDLPGVLTSGPVTAGPWSSLACWVVYAGVASAFAVRLLGRTASPPEGDHPVPSGAPASPQNAGKASPQPLWSGSLAWAGAATALAVNLAVLLICAPGEEITPGNWGWGAAGWLAMLALWNRPLFELVVFIVVNALSMAAVMVARGTLDRQSFAAWLTVVVSSGSLQWGLSLVVRMLVVTSTQVVDRAAELSQDAVRRARERTIRATRARLAASIHADAHPLLCALSAGSPPEDEGVRHRCAVAAARIRRLVLQTRGSRNPLGDELSAAADIAASRGVVVDLDLHGELPVVPPADLQALTEAPLRALAVARQSARVTVAAFDGGVVVGVLSDADEAGVVQEGRIVGGDPAIGPPTAVRWEVRRFDSGRQTWIESSWTPTPTATPAQSPSP